MTCQARRVTRDELEAALVAVGGAAVETCRAVLAGPNAKLTGGGARTASTANLVAIYRRRADHVRAIGLPCVGFDEAVQRLETTTHTRLRIAVLEGPGGLPWCVVFLAPETTQVVASLAVIGSMSPM